MPPSILALFLSDGHVHMNNREKRKVDKVITKPKPLQEGRGGNVSVQVLLLGTETVLNRALSLVQLHLGSLPEFRNSFEIFGLQNRL